jgi:riboflavin biosynthesis pyrimidine reductase
MRRRSVDGGQLTEDDLIAAYAVDDRAQPHLRVNMVTSLDGAVTLAGLSGGLSSREDQELLARLRMLADAVLVGAGTLRAEGYDGLRLSEQRRTWRQAHGLPENPVLAVVSAALDLAPTNLALVDAPVRPVVITRAGAPAERRAALSEVADVLVCGQDEVDLRAAVDELAARGLRQIVCEGGPRLLGRLDRGGPRGRVVLVDLAAAGRGRGGPDHGRRPVVDDPPSGARARTDLGRRFPLPPLSQGLGPACLSS